MADFAPIAVPPGAAPVLDAVRRAFPEAELGPLVALQFVRPCAAHPDAHAAKQTEVA